MINCIIPLDMGVGMLLALALGVFFGIVLAVVLK